MSAKMLFVHALSPLHAGTGQGIGVIDLPIAREKATGLPYLPGSSLKGSLRDRCEEAQDPNCVKIFGPPTDKAKEYAGAVQFSDQRLLLLPVRSLAGTFAWVTSPYLLQRLKRDAAHVTFSNTQNKIPTDIPDPTAEGCIVAAPTALNMNDTVILEDLKLNIDDNHNVNAWGDWLAEQIFPNSADWQTMLKKRLCLVHDDVMGFLLETATEVTARIKLLDDSKTVQQGGLWYEEALPTETILSGLVVATPVKKTNLAHAQIYTTVSNLTNKVVQFGGNATVGRGLCQLSLRGDG